MISRRQAMCSVAGLALGAAARPARAAGEAGEAGVRMPVALVSHGGPLLAIDPVRGPALRAWGAALRRPRGIVAMTPHWGSRAIELGATGPGVALYDFPAWLANRIPPNLTYASPPSHVLAVRVQDLLGGPARARPGYRRGMDHTTWMPLMHMFPAADVPILEIAYPYRGDADQIAIGRALAPLRDEGVLILASGGVTHNLAAVDFDHPDAPPPSWSSEFDHWAAEAFTARDADALVDWRHRAPAADLAHPDDGGHFRVMLVAFGATLDAPAHGTRFPSDGYEGGLSMRCVELS